MSSSVSTSSDGPCPSSIASMVSDENLTKSIEYEIIHKGKRIKDIILEICDNDKSRYELNKYQIALNFLIGILSLKDHRLLEQLGQDILNFLIEIGICNNTQWFAVYSELNLNPTVTENVAKLIAPYIDLQDITIVDANVEVLSTLLKYVDIHEVTLDISGSAEQAQFSVLMDVLRSKQCNIKIPNISDSQLNLWNAIITPYDKFQIAKMTLKHEYPNLPLPSCGNTIDEYCLQHHWREHSGPAPNMAECVVRKLRTAVHTTDTLPTTLERLYLRLLVEPVTLDARKRGIWSTLQRFIQLGGLEKGHLAVPDYWLAQDPGFAHLTQHCSRLEYLGVHVRVEAVTKHLPNLPNVRYTSLYLPQLTKEDHLQWAVDTARALQPPRLGYRHLFLPNCGLHVRQLCKLVGQLAVAGVTVQQGGDVVVSSNHSESEQYHLLEATRQNLHCRLKWYQSDDELIRNGWW
ncbi:unnamed protein product [Meganyctiphanes norvegica]|uniref:Uncharacterized protein n=1 Tax=Meganyctiphanes norvegica TaxID=48144 RepID=A0AAV2QPB8_MEGNR